MLPEKRKEEKKGKEKRDNKLFLYAQEALNIMKDMQKYISDIYRKKTRFICLMERVIF